MPENDNIALALLASSISTTAEEAAKSTEGHIIAQQAKDPKAALALSSLENMQIDLNCFADACDFLSSQLSDTAKVKDLVAEKGSELFWKCIRLTLEEWRSNTESSLARLKGQKSKTDWKMKLAEKLNEEFAFVKVNTEAAMQDAQMTIALVNLCVANFFYPNEDQCANKNAARQSCCATPPQSVVDWASCVKILNGRWQKFGTASSALVIRRQPRARYGRSISSVNSPQV